MGQYVEARQFLERVLEADWYLGRSNTANHAVFLNNLGTVLFMLGDHMGALDNLQRALSIQQVNLRAEKGAAAEPGVPASKEKHRKIAQLERQRTAQQWNLRAEN